MEPILQTLNKYNHGMLVIHAKKINKTRKKNGKCARLGYSFITCTGTVSLTNQVS